MHGGVTARRHYAMNIEFPNQLQLEMVANFREISRLWHAFLESTSSVSMPAGETTAEGQQGPAAEAEGQRQQQQPAATSAPAAHPHNRAGRGAESGRKRRAANDAMLEWRRVPDEDELERRLEIGLHGLFGEGARWKTAEQHESARQVMSLQGGKVLMVVLPTGAGKSALFMLPAVPGVHGGVSIVVVPFVALLSSLTRSARRAGLDFLLWQPASVTGRVERVRVAPLVFVGAEYANCAEFASYAEGLRARGLLKRIFVDECHTVLTDAAYRPQLLGLRGLHRYDRPVILLTATLPVRMEGWFRRLMVADEASIVRASTARPNIRYRVTCCSGQGPGPGGFSSIEAAVLSKVRQTERVMGQGQKGVVYCRSKQKCERLAAEIGCSFYHGSVSADGREEALEAWSSGRSPSRWMAATTGLGSGVDIQASWPFSTRRHRTGSWTSCSRRGGRSGRGGNSRLGGLPGRRGRDAV
ncbi:ATP-dependent DNA helicase Q5 [Colletotrichum higginsianum]|uniref:DNA 3'-5' helicase n=1 Tax=Colletotrichum higginsianum TaxID=80884 RepID=A0A4T0VBP2_9PEZI|nr:ATP-dependent DNA helicase Q5 [Colletotrichum higginsianum]